jgi:serine/threonine protein kinase
MLQQTTSYTELVGALIDNYVVDKVLGTGGQAVVFLAHGKGLHTNYALKVFGLMDSDAAGLTNGLSEARNQSRIEHESIVKVYEPGIADVDFQGSSRSILYIPMQYAPLGSCEETPPFRDKELTIRNIESLIGLLDGLNSIHKHGIIHRDIKPANILRFEERHWGEDATVLRITDFGIAKVLFAIGAGEQVKSGMTLPYMSPEQPDRDYSEKGDVYSMGATLFYMVTGEQPIPEPHDSWDVLAWQDAHRNPNRPNAMDHNPYCPPRVALLIMEMMSVDPVERPSLDQCIEVLRSHINHMSQKTLEFAVPDDLRSQLASDASQIRYSPTFRGVFEPAVHLMCGTKLYVIRIQMTYPVFSLYQRLIEYMIHKFSDCFCMYETYGTYDIHIFLWSDPERTKTLKKDLKQAYPGSDVEVYAATNINHIHVDEVHRRGSRTIVGALAVQERIRLSNVEASSYLCGEYPEKVPRHSIRAFTYVDAVLRRSLDPGLIRVAIVESARKRMLEIIDRVEEVGQTVDGQINLSILRQRFPRITIIELESDRTDQPVMVVNFVAIDFKYLHEVAAAIVEIGETAVKTSTFIETGRIVIQSDKILF